MEDNELKIALEQYSVAIDLYKHEDSLNWSKLNNLFYVNAGLLAVLGLQFARGQLTSHSNPLIWALSILGFLVSFAFIISIWSGIIYMHKRKERIVEIEEELFKIGGKHVVSASLDQSKKILEVSPTSIVLRVMPIIFTFAWLIIIFMLTIFPDKISVVQ